MDLSTKFMGLTIKNPLVVSSSGLTNTADKIKKCEDHGAGAVVLKSLFEEQLIADKSKLHSQDDMYFWYPEAINFVDTFSKDHGVAQYLSLIQEAKKKVNIPVIASINCVSPVEWPSFAKKIEESGADGLELNIFIPPTEIGQTPNQIEEIYIDIVREVKKNTNLPIAVKIGYFFTNIVRTVFKLSNTDIESIVLFNRYYRPDIDIDKLQVIAKNIYSSPEEITLSLRWIALLSGLVKSEMVGATGVHSHEGLIKYILSGANAVQLCSALYKNGLEYMEEILKNLEFWMKNKGYNSISDFKGIISKAAENKHAFERIQFMQKTTGKL
ncbi:MAG: dihydroorotate dehydrogenase-like protein [Bacteroidales bacterium]|nr:dihydroorotate dehydrogenase-like protein [Bacteroidales bacterium]